MKQFLVLFPAVMGVTLIGVAIVTPAITTLALLLSLPWFCAAGVMFLQLKEIDHE